MNEDLENELKENPELASVVARLRNSAELELSSADIIGGHKGPTAVWYVWNPLAILVAASLLAVLAFSVWFLVPDSRSPSPDRQVHPSYGAREYHQTPAEMIATQNADGSWQNDFLTRRNAEILRGCGTPGAQVAYKKAMRNLRTRGVL